MRGLAVSFAALALALSGPLASAGFTPVDPQNPPCVLGCRVPVSDADNINPDVPLPVGSPVPLPHEAAKEVLAFLSAIAEAFRADAQAIETAAGAQAAHAERLTHEAARVAAPPVPDAPEATAPVGAPTLPSLPAADPAWTETHPGTPARAAPSSHDLAIDIPTGALATQPPIQDATPARPGRPAHGRPQPADAHDPPSDAAPSPRGTGMFAPQSAALAAPASGGERWLASGGFRLALALTLSLILPYLALYRRIAREHVLESAPRRAILAHVVGRPGATAAEIARAVRLHYMTIRHHLAILAESGLLNERVVGANLRYFENHGRYAPAEERALAAGAREENASFLRAVATHPGETASAIGARAGLARSTAFRRAAILQRDGLLTSERGALRLTPAGAQALARATAHLKTPGAAPPS